MLLRVVFSCFTLQIATYWRSSYIFISTFTVLHTICSNNAQLTSFKQWLLLLCSLKVQKHRESSFSYCFFLPRYVWPLQICPNGNYLKRRLAYTVSCTSAHAPEQGIEDTSSLLSSPAVRGIHDFFCVPVYFF